MDGENTTVSSRQRVKIRFSFEAEYAGLLKDLPWHKPLSQWNRREAKFLDVKSGLSRHVVRFIEIGNRAFAVKETSAEVASKELHSYQQIQRLGVPALLPVGTVIRDEGLHTVETHLGPQAQPQTTGYIVTQLLDFALPHSFLFRRSFTKANRRRIWDAIVRLFVQMHCKGVYWGDASLSNMMIVFAKQPSPEIGIRTVLRAVLADAETVEVHHALSERLRTSDVEYFLESMAWTEADMKASGFIRGRVMTLEDQEYLLRRYMDLFEVEREEQKFELLTKIDVDALLGSFETSGQSKALLKHIYEHKWYLSERVGKEVSLEAAAEDWYRNHFKPVLRLFNESEILDDLQERTASSLYLDIMLHKFYLSERVGKDVGLLSAFGDYSRQFKHNDKLMDKLSKLGRLIQHLLAMDMDLNA